MPIRGKHIGIVLSGGASTRMGQPKALLKAPENKLLADAQCDLLKNAGCSSVFIVAGAHFDEIRKQSTYEVVFNSDWKKGRFTSVQVGLNTCNTCKGILILPVDTAGINKSTIRQILQETNDIDPEALRPIHNGKKGHLVWISRKLAEHLLSISSAEELRLDKLLAKFEAKLEVNDPAILNNFNTPEEWSHFLEGDAPTEPKD